MSKRTGKYTYTSHDFQQRKTIGEMAELQLGYRLRGDGIQVIRPSYPEGKHTSWYTENQVDLIANGFILEVKSRSVRFNSTADYPYDDILIESVSGYQKKVIKPDYYVNISQVTGATLTLHVESTMHAWEERKIKDRTRGFKYTIYLAPLHLWRPYETLVADIKHSHKTFLTQEGVEYKKL